MTDPTAHHESDDTRTVRLRQWWTADCGVLAPEAPPGLRDAEVERLLSGWSEPQRRYHSLQHLAEVLAAIEELVAAGETDQVGARVARVAGWFHDLAYDPRAEPGSNEHRSATLARDHLHALGVARGTVDVVEALVLLTVDHTADRERPALASWRHTAAVFHDADLWILSAPRDRYREYADQVRQEYAHVPAPLFARARSAIMAGLVSRDAVYRTGFAHAHWEQHARANVAAELATLST